MARKTYLKTDREYYADRIDWHFDQGTMMPMLQEVVEHEIGVDNPWMSQDEIEMTFEAALDVAAERDDNSR